MDEKNKLIYDTKRLMLSKYPHFGSEIASANIEYRTDLKYHTAATDGKNIYFNPNYLASLNDDDRLFLIAHELMHIKFAHALRLLDKNGKKRDMEIWNEATDAIINANLERDGFKIKKGYVNRPEALKYSAEEFYQILLEEKANKNNQNKQNDTQSNPNDTGDGQQQDSNRVENEKFIDDHSLWEESFESIQKQGSLPSIDKDDKFNEREQFSKNRQERLARAKENLERMKEEILKNIIKNETTEEINLGNVGESKNYIDWTLLLRREFDKSETIWSQRRSIAENNYAYRLEENDIEDEAKTEAMIDISGSVDLELVKAFLRI